MTRTPFSPKTQLLTVLIGHHLDTSAYVEDLDGFFDRIEAKNKVELRKAIKKRT